MGNRKKTENKYLGKIIKTPFHNWAYSNNRDGTVSITDKGFLSEYQSWEESSSCHLVDEDNIEKYGSETNNKRGTYNVIGVLKEIESYEGKLVLDPCFYIGEEDAKVTTDKTSEQTDTKTEDNKAPQEDDSKTEENKLPQTFEDYISQRLTEINIFSESFRNCYKENIRKNFTEALKTKKITENENQAFGGIAQKLKFILEIENKTRRECRNEM
ncbi:MAG: hypothetical protein IKW39_00785 [Alphaproteobacteria bacterium]|nr:hypothetical protein [Alphaproteobacteria bacterium]